MKTILDDSIRVYFVINTRCKTDMENAATDQYAYALHLMRGHIAETQIREIRPIEGFPLIASGGLTKKDVFVMALFEGDLFEQLQMTPALVLGPPCIVECIAQCAPIPFGSSPIYTTSMRNLQISASGVSSKEKDELKMLIHWMGGHYYQNFGRNITHLISNTIQSNKYEHATLSGVPVMHADWVKRVWECGHTSKNSTISANDERFGKYRLPTFFGANITCSGLEATVKDAVTRLVNENGGIYHRAFRSQQVDIVITEQFKTDSEKYKAAVRFKKDILLPQWIFDSHERGYALPIKEYEVRPRKKVSTPTKQNATHPPADQTQLSDLSGISFVTGSGRRMCNDNTTVNETLGSSNSDVTVHQLLKRAQVNSSSINYNQLRYQQTLAAICPRSAKQAGSFLDGCCVYLFGFRAAEREKLNRVLNTGGATRYDDPHEGLTHIIIGQMDISTYRQWQSNGLLETVQVVQLEWLLESIRGGYIANELPHRISLTYSGEQPVIASPGSKRTLRSMNQSFKQPTTSVKKKLFEGEMPVGPETELETVLVTHYSQVKEPAKSLPSANSTQLSLTETAAEPAASAATVTPAFSYPDLSNSTLSIDFDKLDYLMGSSVYVHQACFSSELYEQMVSECKAAQASLVPQSFTDLVDFAIVSFEQVIDTSTLPIQSRHLVTEIYLESCMKQNKLLPLKYYHRPVPFNAKKEPLRGLTIVVSIYAGLERDFINALAELQGASLNKAYVKKEKPLLVCSNAKGSKYEGAIKWGYPVVHSEWLLQCAQRGEKLPFDRFKVGESVSDFPIALSPRRESHKNKTTALPLQSKSPTADLQSFPHQYRSSTERVTLQEENKDKKKQNNSYDVTPLRNPRVSELVTGLPSSLWRSSVCPSTSDSPHTPLGSRGFVSGEWNFDILEHIVQRLETSQARDCVNQIIREMRQNKTPELERIRRQACTPMNRRQTSRPAPSIPYFCLTPEFQHRMAAEFERQWRLPKHQIKPETPISVIRQRVMRITCEALGIDYTPSDEMDEQNPQDNQQVGRILFQQEPAVSDSPFIPNTQSHNAVDPAITQHSEKQTSRSTINFDKINFEEAISENLTDLKQISDYLQKRESRLCSVKRNHEGRTKSQSHHIQPFESERFLHTSEDIVDWRDPAEFIGVNRNSDDGLPYIRQISTPCFSISCGDDEENRKLLLKRVKELGGNICQNLVSYDSTCTHLLCERPNRGEKLLACMAAGKWVLNVNYIERCHAHGAFLDESLYEWGNPKALNQPNLSPEEQTIAVSAHRWRTQLSDGGEAFKGYRVILSLQERSQEAIKNVLRAGGAYILEPQTPFNSDPTAAGATHCFMDIKKAPLAPHDLAYLQEHGVRIMSQMWINSYLMGGRDDNLEKYVLHK